MRITKVNQRISRLDEQLSKLLHLKEHPKRRLHESLSDWADREVQIACKGEDGYGAGCYQSALKAFRSLMDDGHSGCSIGFTKAILNRLIDGKPLTPINDTPEEWGDQYSFYGEKGHYQHTRASSVFKTVSPDGSVEYSDVDRTVLVEVADDGTETTWHSGLASKLVNEIVGPITFPYYPSAKPYKVYAHQFDSVNAEVGCFDTSHILKIVDPDGNEIDCERFYVESGDRGFQEVGREEYAARVLSYRNALKSRVANK
ncbi:MAG: hypothetical protein IKT27_03940 [Clostridia bacterium]|nr:hypothetical protein [Clostridia bacterium]